MKTRKLVTKSNSIHGRNFVNISSLQLLHYIHAYVLDILRKKMKRWFLPMSLSIKSTFALIYVSRFAIHEEACVFICETHTACLLLSGTTLQYVWNCTSKVYIHVSILNVAFFLSGIVVESFENRSLNWYELIDRLVTARLLCKVTHFSPFILQQQLEELFMRVWIPSQYHTGICSLSRTIAKPGLASLDLGSL